MAIEDILLREKLNDPLVTKGEKLNNNEIDVNFIEIFTEFRRISDPINTTSYDNATTYVGGESTLVSFASQLWIFISPTDKTGVSPGSDPLVWNREAVNRIAHEDVNLVSLTRAELLALQIAKTVHPSRLYFITDRDVFVSGVTKTQVSLKGALLARNPDYQNVGGNVLGVWTDAIDDGSPGLQVNDIAIYNGLQWESRTGDTTGVIPPDDPLNWELLPTTDSSYINEIDPIHYDLLNDVIIKRSDKRGNVVETENSFIDAVSPALNPIDVFQWGNDSVKGNKVKQNSILTSLNNLKSIEYVELKDSDITANMQTNSVKTTIYIGQILDISASPVDIVGEFNVSDMIPDIIKISKVFGDFSDASLVFDISVFTLKAGRKLQEFVIKHETLWGDGAVNITSVVVELGIVGDEGIYSFEPFDILQAPGDTILRNAEPNVIENWNADTDIRMRITVIGDNLDQLTTGSIDLFIFTKRMKPDA